jgi:hypothetical protein
MEINLRKANAIQAEIRRAVNLSDAKDTISVTEFTQDIAGEFNKGVESFRTEVTRRVALTTALFNIRKSVGEANATAGINSILAEVQGIDATMAIYSGVATKQPAKTLDEIHARVEKIKNTPTDGSVRASIYGERYNNVETSVVVAEQIAEAKEKVRSLKRQRQNLQDKLLALNVNTLITISDVDANVLKLEGIL